VAAASITRASRRHAVLSPDSDFLSAADRSPDDPGTINTAALREISQPRLARAAIKSSSRAYPQCPKAAAAPATEAAAAINSGEGTSARRVCRELSCTTFRYDPHASGDGNQNVHG
jgi:hypothetical protein